MKILHLGDLHLGKRVNEISMIEDQKFILDQIVTLVKEEKIDVILLCGDIYDKAIPTIEAIHLLDEFLEEMSDLKVKVLMISGNHDSSERMSFGRNLFKRSNLYIASQFNQEIEKITIKEDGYNINFYMLPFVKPANINHVLKIQTETYEALKTYIRLNYDGLKDSVIKMLGGDKVQINTGTFSNDMATFQGKDDVLTLDRKSTRLNSSH